MLKIAGNIPLHGMAYCIVRLLLQLSLSPRSALGDWTNVFKKIAQLGLFCK